MISLEEQQTFDLICDTAKSVYKDARLAVVETTERETGKRVIALVVVKKVGKDFDLHPVGTVIPSGIAHGLFNEPKQGKEVK